MWPETDAKQKLRREYLKRRSELPACVRNHLSTHIQEKAADWILNNNIKKISIYLAYLSEVSTYKLAAFCLAEKLEVWVPVVDYDRKKVFHARLVDLARLKRDKKGIPIPDSREIKEDVRFDVVFCPGVVFDRNGHRLGYGEGYYDRFLERAADAVKVGLCFSVQLIDELPAETHDVHMDYVITENEILSCK